MKEEKWFPKNVMLWHLFDWKVVHHRSFPDLFVLWLLSLLVCMRVVDITFVLIYSVWSGIGIGTTKFMLCLWTSGWKRDPVSWGFPSKVRQHGIDEFITEQKFTFDQEKNFKKLLNYEKMFNAGRLSLNNQSILCFS